MRITAMGILCLYSSSLFAALLGDNVQFITYKATKHSTRADWGEALLDITNHEAPGDSNNYNDKVTLGHETSHGIHAYLRNKNTQPGKRVNAFYVLHDRGVIVEEPKIRKSQVAPFVPPSLRGSRYSTYITGQSAWDDTPLYIFDEWNAYVNGAEVGVDLVNKKLWKDGWRDAVMGPLEFSVYALATAQAVKKLDPTYFSTNKQFLEFVAWNLRRSMDLFLEGSLMSSFTWKTQDDYFRNLRKNPDAEGLRAFARETFGDEWCYFVFWF
jgi:hypothetical protein